MAVRDLKTLLGARNLPVFGNKADRVARLIEFAQRPAGESDAAVAQVASARGSCIGKRDGCLHSICRKSLLSPLLERGLRAKAHPARDQGGGNKVGRLYRFDARSRSGIYHPGEQPEAQVRRVERWRLEQWRQGPAC